MNIGQFHIGLTTMEERLFWRNLKHIVNIESCIFYYLPIQIHTSLICLIKISLGLSLAMCNLNNSSPQV